MIDINVYNYAKALFKAALEEDILDEIVYDYQTLVQSLKIDATNSWLDLVDSPVLSKNEKTQLIKGIKNLHPIFVNFLIMLTNNYHIRLYEEIYIEFMILAQEKQKIAHIRVMVAKPLTPNQLKYIRRELNGWFEDMEIEMEVIIDKRLLGGIRVMYQGQTIDHSFHSELQELKSNL